jgi:hypothetical protein
MIFEMIRQSYNNWKAQEQHKQPRLECHQEVIMDVKIYKMTDVELIEGRN